MLLTEEEAKTKRCQESFAAAAAISPDGSTYVSSWHYPPPAGGASTPVHTAPSNCVGAACMAWRWHTWTDYQGPNGANEFIPSIKHSTTHGYCGKAGTPMGHGKPTAHPPKET